MRPAAACLRAYFLWATVLSMVVVVSLPALGAQDSMTLQTADQVALYAVIVGISKYGNPRLNLKLAAKDAQDFFEFLKERKGLFRQVNVALRLDEDATRARIVEALRIKLENARKDDIVLIYMAGHGRSHPRVPNEYYFLPHDVDEDNLFATGILMNDSRLFSTIKSERLLLIADSCRSGGYLSGLSRGNLEQRGASFPDFNQVNGRFGMAAAAPKEIATEHPKFGNGIFTFYLLKGLRGAAETNRDGIISVRELFDYVCKNAKEATGGRQNPQLFCVPGSAKETPVYVSRVFPKDLDIKLQYFYEKDQGKKALLTNQSVLTSGQHVGIAFRPDQDCFVHILWWDTQGKVGRLFPNPALTDGTGFVKAGETCWLPSRREAGGKHWYVLDDNPGYETIYFVASRERNPKLERLHEQLRSMGEAAQATAQGRRKSEEIEREVNLIGSAVRRLSSESGSMSFKSKEELFERMEGKIKVSGSEAMFKLRFRHVRR